MTLDKLTMMQRLSSNGGLLAIAQCSQKEDTLEGCAVQFLRDGGLLSQAWERHRERQGQLRVAHLAEKALRENVSDACEAGTGTGKGIGYLSAAILSGLRVIVATPNKALQNQLFNNDILVIRHALKDTHPFEAAMMKGRGNYVCHARVEEYRQEWQPLRQDETFDELDRKMQDVTFDGDMDAMSEGALSHHVRTNVGSSHTLCTGQKCKFRAACYYYKHRNIARAATVVVAGLDLLILDAQHGNHILNKYDAVIIDEAHNLEERTIQCLSTDFRLSTVSYVLRGKVKACASQKTIKALTDQVTTVEQCLQQRLQNKDSVTLTSAIEGGERLACLLETLAEEMNDNPPANMSDHDSSMWEKRIESVKRLADDVRTVLSVAHRDQFVYYVKAERNDKKSVFVITRSPLDVAPHLKRLFFDNVPTFLTSATLASTSKSGNERNFDYLEQSVGIEINGRVSQRIIQSPFDYAHNALLYIPNDIPEYVYGNNPQAQEYQRQIAERILRLVNASRGRAFLLFASRSALEATYEQIAASIAYPVLRQNGEQSTNQLKEQFKRTPNAVLFGLKSFWEGVDIPGDALSLVVIDRLSFAPPDDPVSQAQVSRIKANGGNWFDEYTLPKAVIQLKQGVGRLIRTETDSGVMAILDSRLHTKRYGHKVINALPPARKTCSIEDVERFFLAQSKIVPFKPRRVIINGQATVEEVF